MTRLLGAQLALFILVLAAIMLAYGGPRDFGHQFDGLYLGADFTQYYHPTFVQIRSSGTLTEGFVYPPLFAILGVPLGLAPVKTSLLLWMGMQVLAMVAVCVGIPHLTSRTPPAAALAFTAVCTASVPLLHNLKWGQLSTPLLGLAMLGVVWQRQGDKPLSVGILLGLAATLKIYPALWWAGLRLERRVLAGLFVGALLGGLVLPGLFLGLSGLWAVYGELLHRLADARFLDNTGSQHLAAVVGRWIPGAQGGMSVLCLGLVPLVIVAAQRAVRLPDDGAVWALAIANLLIPLLVPSAWLHTFVFLPLLWWLVVLAPMPLGLRGASVGLSVAMTSLPWFVLAGPAMHYARGGWPVSATLCLVPAVVWHLAWGAPRA